MKRGRKSSNNTFTENGKKIWKCGKYKRLSKEDGHDVSYSIENQDAILDYYLANHPEIQVVDNYQDDGRTGTDSDREDFQRLLADIYAKKINCVIVKDLSRLSRNDYESCSHLALSCLLWSVAAVLETAKILVLQRISDAPTGIDQLHIRKNQSSN